VAKGVGLDQVQAPLLKKKKKTNNELYTDMGRCPRNTDE
jgi:hypothetical protein